MKRMTSALSTAALLLAGAAAYADDDKPKMKDSGAPADLIGAYTIVGGEKYGQKEDMDRLQGTTCRIAEDAIIVLDKDKKEAYVQTYKIDVKSKPWKITMKSKVTPYKDADAKGEAVAMGLIEKEGDTVKLIYAVPGGDMPTEFKTKEKQLMFIMKNENKEQKNK